MKFLMRILSALLRHFFIWLVKRSQQNKSLSKMSFGAILNHQLFPIQMPYFRQKIRKLNFTKKLSVECIFCQMAPFFSHQNGVKEAKTSRVILKKLFLFAHSQCVCTTAAVTWERLLFISLNIYKCLNATNGKTRVHLQA